MQFIHKYVLSALIGTQRLCPHRYYLTAQHVFAWHKLWPLNWFCPLSDWLYHSIVSVLVIWNVFRMQTRLNPLVRFSDGLHRIHFQNILFWSFPPLLNLVDSHGRMQRKLRCVGFGDFFTKKYFSVAETRRSRWLFMAHILWVVLEFIINRRSFIVH